MQIPLLLVKLLHVIIQIPLLRVEPAFVNEQLVLLIMKGRNVNIQKPINESAGPTERLFSRP